MALKAVAEVLSADGIRKQMFNGSLRSAAKNVVEIRHQILRPWGSWKMEVRFPTTPWPEGLCAGVLLRPTCTCLHFSP